MLGSIKLTLLIFFLLVVTISAQVSGWKEDFNDGNLSRWGSEEATYQLSAENGSMKINYTRTSNSSNIWHNFRFNSPQNIDITRNPIITITLKSTVNTVLSIKPTTNADVQLISKDIIGDGVWRTIKFNVTVPASKNFNTIYMYLDGGTTLPKNGIVLFDEIRMGDSVSASLAMDWTDYDRAIISAQALLSNSVEGSGEGKYPSGSKTILQSAFDKVKDLKLQGIKDQKIVDKAVWDLYDACVTFETSVNATSTNLIDKKATKETRYLYVNFLKLAKKILLFGMHDATGYGVGWSGNDNRSDVRDVCGDFPALFSEDMNKVELDQEVERMRYRLSTAYGKGSVITLCWHQYDYTGTSFYVNQLQDSKVVAKYLPGGAYHQEYKDKLVKVARFLKSFRGSKGESIPVIFRPYHEHLGNWFWWGQPNCTPQEYNQIWQFTVKYLRDSLNVHNLMWAISPSLDQFQPNELYFQVYPGDDYVDIFGSDFYFPTSPTTWHSDLMVKGLTQIVRYARARNKIPTLTEVGQENIPTPDWFTKFLLNPIKNDSVASNISYAAVWRNESVTHHFAPYPGDATVPDFLNFFNDPYTAFQSDLPNMYMLPADDKTPPVFVSKHDTVQIATSKLATINVETDERAFLRYSLIDEPFQSMKNQFETGEGNFKHTVKVEGSQGVVSTIFVKASDLYGNVTDKSLQIKFKVDTLQALIAWSDPHYPTKDWSIGKAPLGTSSSAATKLDNVRTAYFRKTLTLDQIPTGLAILVKIEGGAAVSVNNFEVGRINLQDAGVLNYNSEPTSTAYTAKQFLLNSVALSKLKKGENLIAIEVHGTTQTLVPTFDVQVINQNYQTLIPNGSDWNYFDKGYRPKDVKLGDITSVAKNGSDLPTEFVLFPNYPNPFNPSTNIKYQLAKDVHVTMEIFDVLGRKVVTIVNAQQPAGIYQVQFDGSNLASGVYTVMMKAGDYFKVNKMMLVK